MCKGSWNEVVHFRAKQQAHCVCWLQRRSFEGNLRRPEEQRSVLLSHTDLNHRSQILFDINDDGSSQMTSGVRGLMHAVSLLL